MSDKYVDQTGLARILTNLKANFATKSVATTSAAGLMSAADKTKLDGLSSGGGDSPIYIGTTETTVGYADKVVVCPEFTSLSAGKIIIVQFTSPVTIGGVIPSSCTLNVNSTGAKSVKASTVDTDPSTNLTPRFMSKLRGNYTAAFMYDGTYWVLIGDRARDYYGRFSTLWTNSSPTSNFSAQSVTVTYMGDYDLIGIVCAYDTTANTAMMTSFIPVADWVAKSRDFVLHYDNNENNRNGGRKVSSTSNTSITFANGYYNGSSGAKYGIPLKVYGIDLNYT